jgi:hypothetical protein
MSGDIDFLRALDGRGDWAGIDLLLRGGPVLAGLGGYGDFQMFGRL